MSRLSTPPEHPDQTPSPSSTDAQPDSLADDLDPERDEQGRIGYGQLGRWSPVGLAVLILLALAAIYIIDRDNGDANEPRVAPDFELALLNVNGSGNDSVTLDELHGKTVVLNFWASWCEPCREEMPAFQAMSESSGDDVVFVGVGSKTDDQAEAVAFAEEFGITYPIGRDTEGGDALGGQIEQDYGVPGYPATFFISPDGLINEVIFGAIDTEALATYIASASD